MGAFYTPVRRAMYLTLGGINSIAPSTYPNAFILCYHSIAEDWDFSVDSETFKKQMEYLMHRFNIVTLDDIATSITTHTPFARQSVAITFDDGYADVMSIAPYLKKHRIYPTMFVLGDPDHANRAELENNKRFLTPAEIIKLRDTYGWTIGSHTMTHANMLTLKPADIEREIVKSKATIERAIGSQITKIAYPKGRYTEAVLNAVKKAGYMMGVTMDDETITTSTNLIKVPRIGVDQTHTYAEFKVLMSPLNMHARRIIKKLGAV